jgi:hypothetical protein
MEMTLKYASIREEIARRYWQMWRKTLWKIHAATFIVILLAAILLEGNWPIQDYRYVVYGFVVAAAVIIFFISFPQIMYKPQVRSLTVNEGGIYTVVNLLSDDTSWMDIMSIEDTPEHIVITKKKTLHSLLIPRRAFQNNDERKNFLTASQAWQRQASKVEVQAL